MKPLSGFTALVTSGPTHEPIDPVRFLGNRSSGKQGHAIAEALAVAGAKVVLVSGPVALDDPKGVKVIHVQTACEMLAACEVALPVDIAICAAAVADWRVRRVASQKVKKSGEGAPVLELVENPDILRTLSRRKKDRPRLVIGFAAETEKVLANARAKHARKGCDWMLANDVSGGKGFDAEKNRLTLMTQETETAWPEMSKHAIARKLVEQIVETLC